MKKTRHPVKVVITGGPSAGKTTLTEILGREFSHKLAIVPEAASILYQGGVSRDMSLLGRVFRQRAIYLLQRELEDYVSKAHPKKLIICDRGSLDALAYWPSHINKSFYSEMKTTAKKELKRYDWVIHLDTAGEGHYVLSDLRTESHKTALQLNKGILKAWKDHPRRIVITNSTDFSTKMQMAIDIISAILAGEHVIGE